MVELSKDTTFCCVWDALAFETTDGDARRWRREIFRSSKLHSAFAELHAEGVFLFSFLERILLEWTKLITRHWISRAFALL